MAVLQATKLGRTEDALRTLDHVSSPVRGQAASTHAALWLQVRILCGRAIDDGAARRPTRTCTRSPGTPAAAIAERITVTE